MPVDEIRKVCFVGGGSMGSFNSLLAAAHGYEAFVYDPSPQARETVPARQRQLAAYMAGEGTLAAELVEPALRRVHVVDDPEVATDDADLLSESVPERLELKREVLRRFDAICPAKTVFTTNTSILLVSELEDAVVRGERFAAFHSHLGALLFDLVGGARTDDRTLDLLRRYGESLGGTVLLHERQHRGYLANSLIQAVNSTALSLVARHQSSLEDVDRAWMAGEGARCGPFGLMDFVGLDVVYDVSREVARENHSWTWFSRVLAMLKARVDLNQLGLKTGVGFYHYPDPDFLRPGFLSEKPVDPGVQDALRVNLVAAAVLLAAEGYATPAVIDLTWTSLMHTRLSPFAILTAMGREAFLKALAGNGNRQTSITRENLDAIRKYLTS